MVIPKPIPVSEKCLSNPWLISLFPGFSKSFPAKITYAEVQSNGGTGFLSLQPVGL
jgi:hypothetical protein